MIVTCFGTLQAFLDACLKASSYASHLDPIGMMDITRSNLNQAPIFVTRTLRLTYAYRDPDGSDRVLVLQDTLSRGYEMDTRDVPDTASAFDAVRRHLEACGFSATRSTVALPTDVSLVDGSFECLQYDRGSRSWSLKEPEPIPDPAEPTDGPHAE